VTLQPFGLEGRIKWLDLFPVEVKALHVVDFKEENYRENNKEQIYEFTYKPGLVSH